MKLMMMVMMAVIVSFRCQLDTNLESLGKREPQPCFHHIGVWLCCGAFSKLLIDEGPSPLWGVSFLGR